MDYKEEVIKLIMNISNERLIRIIYGMLVSAAKKEEGN